MANSKEYIRKYQRSRRIRLASQGICTQCCSRPADVGFTSCGICRANAKARRKHIPTHEGSNPWPPQPIICPICESIPNRFYWHHWVDSHPELGIWVCPYCNIIVELEDKGLVDKYRKVRDEATDNYNNKLLKEMLNLRYLST